MKTVYQCMQDDMENLDVTDLELTCTYGNCENQAVREVFGVLICAEHLAQIFADKMARQSLSVAA